MRHGSLINHVQADASAPPKPGDGCTLYGWTDRKAGTVTSVSITGRIVSVREDTAIRTDDNGMSDAQHYRYEPNPKGRTYTFTRRKNGRYYEEGSRIGTGTKVSFGERDAYHDYSF